MKVAFLDRDGVINKEVNYLYKISDFEYTDNCLEAMLKLNELGFEIIIVTNQAGIAKGYYTEEQYQKLTDWYLSDLKKKGIKILDVYHCPHHSNAVVEKLRINCYCRKPNPGMLLEAKDKYDIDMKKSFIVGDKLSDIESGILAGVGKQYLVRTGHSLQGLEISKYLVKDDLLSIVNELSNNVC